MVRQQNEGSFGYEAVAFVSGYPNVPEFAVVFFFLSCLYAAKIPLSSCRLFCLFTMNANVFGLGEGGDFTHQLSYEEPKFKYRKNCHTKHCTATFAKPVLPPVVLPFVSVSTVLSAFLLSA